VIAIDHKKCDECGTCISVCQKDALALKKELSVSPDKCVSCGICITICPVEALSAEKSG
jgi:MinD superfamily P-loop ATPase